MASFFRLNEELTMRISALLRPAGSAAMAVAVLVFLAGPAPAAAPDPLFAVEMQQLAASDPGAALEAVDREIAARVAEVPPDLRTLADLYRLKADLLERLERFAEAADTLATLARLVSSHRDELEADPVPLARRAAALYERAGDLRRAERTLQEVLSEESASAMPPEVRRQTLDTLATLANRRDDARAADGYRKAAAEVGTEAEQQATRGTDGEPFSRVRIYYATDRARTGEIYPSTFYGYGRGDVDYGTAIVTIPKTHVPGQIEEPSIWDLEFAPSTAKHVVLKSVEPVAKDEFFSRMHADLDEKHADDAFVFVHGYNVSFDAAAKRTAQLAYDMGFDGVPILYSWPSRASTLSYIADTAVVRLSGRHLSQFLQDVAERSGATHIHLIAHSMGNRAMTDALELMALRIGQAADAPPVFDQVVFAAPDVDAGLFAEMAKTIRPLAQRLTLYASNQDWALEVSRKLHGDQPRAGQGGNDMLAVPVLDSIDMSTLGEDMLRHGYFADDQSALVDLASLFWRNPPPASRCGIEERPARAAVPVWDYHPEDCDGKLILPLIARLREARIHTLDQVHAAILRIVKDQALASRVEPLVTRLLQ